jgi:hypothetical protein
MTVRSMNLSRNRRLVVAERDMPLDLHVQRPFATLLPAYDTIDGRQAENVAGRLIELGCVEFCLVGPQAERIHDALDEIIEARDALNVVTTWHDDELEGCEYFLFAAGGQAVELLAFTSPHTELQTMLEKAARA